MHPRIAQIGEALRATEGSRVHSELARIKEAEADYGVWIHSNLGGYTTLADSFQTFLVETLLAAFDDSADGSKLDGYGLFLIEVILTHRTLRASETLFRRGHPMSGLVLLRDLKDRAILAKSALNGEVDFQVMLGQEALSSENPDAAVRNARKKAEFEVRANFVGRASGLHEATRDEIFEWEQFFHSEVHGARLSYTEYFGALLGEDPLSLMPPKSEASSAGYFNRATEVMWMWHRLLAFLQPTQDGFGEEWGEKWRLLNEGFAVMQESLADLGKEIGSAFTEFLNEKFGGSEADRFPSAS